MCANGVLLENWRIMEIWSINGELMEYNGRVSNVEIWTRVNYVACSPPANNILDNLMMALYNTLDIFDNISFRERGVYYWLVELRFLLIKALTKWATPLLLTSYHHHPTWGKAVQTPLFQINCLNN